MEVSTTSLEMMTEMMKLFIWQFEDSSVLAVRQLHLGEM